MTAARGPEHGLPVIAAWLVAAAGAIAQPPSTTGGEVAGRAASGEEVPATRVLIDTQLRAREVRVISIGPESLGVRPPSGGPAQTIPRGDVLALLPPGDADEAPAASDAAWLQGIDGRVLPGQLASEPAGAEQVAWESRLWGRVVMPLEQVAALVLRPGESGRAPAGMQDRLRLVNGDLAEGFVAQAGPLFVLERDGRRSEVPSMRVVGAWLANDPAPPRGVWVWMADGTATSVRDLSMNGGEVTLRDAQGDASVRRSASELRALLLDASRMTPLAALKSEPPEPATSRRWTPPIVVGEVRESPLFAASVELPGPMGVMWTLPAGAVRVAGVAELPARCREWGDCEVLIETPGAGEPIRRRLWGGEATFEFSLDVPPGATRLRVVVDPGPSGPVQDRVTLRRTLVLVK